VCLSPPPPPPPSPRLCLPSTNTAVFQVASLSGSVQVSGREITIPLAVDVVDEETVQYQIEVSAAANCVQRLHDTVLFLAFACVLKCINLLFVNHAPFHIVFSRLLRGPLWTRRS
jgi:hypothetical protein